MLFFLNFITATLATSGCEKEHLNLHEPPLKGYLQTNCSAYDAVANRAWLPNAYLENAKCACSVIPNCPSANCVRERIQFHHENHQQWIDPSVHERAVQLKSNGSALAYHGFVQRNLVQYFKDLHDEAYQYCGCPGKPYQLITWKLAALIQSPCRLSNYLLKQGASCHATPGYW